MKKIYFSDNEDKSDIRHFNLSNTIMIHLLRKERMSFHQVCFFPYNILVLLLEDDGSGESFINVQEEGNFYRLKANRFYFIPTGKKAEYNLQRGICYYTFHVGVELFPGLDLYNQKEPSREGDATKLIRTMNRIWKEPDSLRQACAVRQLLLGFFLEHWPQNMPERHQDYEQYASLLQYINEHCDARMSVEELAERMNSHPDVFSRKFKLLFGVPPKAFMNRILLRKLSALFANPEISIKTAAEQLHFSSEYYLSRFMKKHTGFPPGAYQRLVACRLNDTNASEK